MFEFLKNGLFSQIIKAKKIELLFERNRDKIFLGISKSDIKLISNRVQQKNKIINCNKKIKR